MLNRFFAIDSLVRLCYRALIDIGTRCSYLFSVSCHLIHECAVALPRIAGGNDPSPAFFFFIPHYLANHSSAFICASHFTYQWTGQGDNVEVRIFRLMDWCCDCAFHSSTRENFVDGREKVCAPVGISTLVLVGICVCWREKSSRRILHVASTCSHHAFITWRG
jgi:hypothetical protein